MGIGSLCRRGQFNAHPFRSTRIPFRLNSFRVADQPSLSEMSDSTHLPSIFSILIDNGVAALP